MKATVFEKYDDFETAGKGAMVAAYSGNRIATIVIKCPGCGQISGLPIRPAPDAKQSWEVSNWPHSPTLTPSVNHMICNGGCGFHGWLRNGEWHGC